MPPVDFLTINTTSYILAPHTFYQLQDGTTGCTHNGAVAQWFESLNITFEQHSLEIIKSSVINIGYRTISFHGLSIIRFAFIAAIPKQCQSPISKTQNIYKLEQTLSRWRQKCNISVRTDTNMHLQRSQLWTTIANITKSTTHK